MKALRVARRRQHLSQRRVAARAGLSFRGYQLLEQPGHDARLGSLEKAAAGLGLPGDGIRRVVRDLFLLDPDSIRVAALRMLADDAGGWTVPLFDFVDAFRRRPHPELVAAPPPDLPSARLGALVAATVEALCAEVGIPPPAWCHAVPPLTEPWFVSGVENLKASALAESPLPFRRRNVFVLDSFLDRA